MILLFYLFADYLLHVSRLGISTLLGCIRLKYTHHWGGCIQDLVYRSEKEEFCYLYAKSINPQRSVRKTRFLKQCSGLVRLTTPGSWK